MSDFRYTPEYCREYFYRSSSDMLLLCDAIIDKRDGLGMIWAYTDIDTIFERLDKYPGNWVIGQARDDLRILVDELRRKDEL